MRSLVTNSMDIFEKNFDQWNQTKKNLEKDMNSLDNFPKEGEVWVSYLGKNIGVEQNGGIDNFSRPVLVIKKFNNQMFWVVPLSTKQKKFDFYFNFKDKNNQQASVVLAQLKLMSSKRFKRNLYKISRDDFVKIKGRLKEFIS
jgi:mRNA interferase MazF